MSELDHIVRVLKSGGTILYPTDTIWGIGCDATNAGAVDRVLNLKVPNVDQPLIVLVDSIQMLHRYVSDVHPRIETLLSYHQRPLTVIYDDCHNLPHNVLDGHGSVAIRVTLDPFCREVIGSLGRPLIANDASDFSMDLPIRFSDIDHQIMNGVDYVVNYKQDQVNDEFPSVIVRLTDKSELDFIRE
ncbi:MAG: Sua5/YciO/YrdC/YwlC family protein [Saprospiraceae bacterium]|nr:Sua5/YciO/YrdC/YwlC family protein [Saprospiraceae bacterium]